MDLSYHRLRPRAAPWGHPPFPNGTGSRRGPGAAPWDHLRFPDETGSRRRPGRRIDAEPIIVAAQLFEVGETGHARLGSPATPRRGEDLRLGGGGGAAVVGSECVPAAGSGR